ncbi:MAG: hypothetical protein V1717_00060 [Candidatus Micrarchaeota archaeon]
MIELLLVLAVSLFVLARASELVVDNSLVLANYFKLSELVVGFLLVSVATSLPELSIAITSLFEHAGSVSAGNVLGANVADVTMVLGAALVASSFKISKNDLWKSANLLVLAALAPFLLIFFPGFWTSILLLAVFLAYSILALRQKSEKTHSDVSKRNALFAVFFFAFGVLLLLVSADFVVKNAVALASLMGVSSVIIGATIVSIGTTLPELTVSLQAVRKSNYHLAIGNAVGSTVVNSTLILGVASFGSLNLNQNFTVLAVLFLVVAGLVSAILHSTRLDKIKGWVLIALYVAFLALTMVLEAVG